MGHTLLEAIVSQEYPPDWDSRRRKVYKRDNYTCQNCGAKGGPKGNAELHAHHIVPKSKGGTHQPTNLKTMCSDCHKAIHGNSLAPTAHGEAQSNTQGFFSELREVTADASFNECPLCDSNHIGNENASDGVVGCANCGVEFEKQGHGYEIVSMDANLLNADLPINYDERLKGHSLRPSVWQKLGSADNISQLDLNRLEEKSKNEEISGLKVVGLTIPIVIGIYYFLFTFTESLQTTLLLGFLVTVPLLVFVGRSVSQSSIDV